jgi:glycine betaine/proline transport system substrate-binding protein
MKSLFGRRSAIVTAAIATALVLSGCGSSVNDSASEAAGDCGSYAIAMHAWGGYTASAQVIADVARQELGCTITQTTLEEGPVT